MARQTFVRWLKRLLYSRVLLSGARSPCIRRSDKDITVIYLSGPKIGNAGGYRLGLEVKNTGRSMTIQQVEKLKSVTDAEVGR